MNVVVKTLILSILSTLILTFPFSGHACDEEFSKTSEFRKKETIIEWRDIYEYEGILWEKLKSYYKAYSSKEVKQVFTKQYGLPRNFKSSNPLSAIRTYNTNQLEQSLRSINRGDHLFILVRGDGSFFETIKGKYFKVNNNRVVVTINKKRHYLKYDDVLDIQKEL